MSSAREKAESALGEAEGGYPGEWTRDQSLAEARAAASLAVADEIRALREALMPGRIEIADLLCPDCEGTGHGEMPVALMADNDAIPDECERCEGTGLMRSALPVEGATNGD